MEVKASPARASGTRLDSMIGSVSAPSVRPKPARASSRGVPAQGPDATKMVRWPIPERVHAALRLRAARTGTTLKAVAVQALEAWVSEELDEI